MADSDHWYTPERYVETARLMLGGIDFDPASDTLANERIEADRIFTMQDDGLAQPWYGRVFCNPPYSNFSKWFEKMSVEFHAGRMPVGILLGPPGVGTVWFTTAIQYHPICFVDHRIAFIREDGRRAPGARQGNLFIYFGHRPFEFAWYFGEFGPITDWRSTWYHPDPDQFVTLKSIAVDLELLRDAALNILTVADAFEGPVARVIHNAQYTESVEDLTEHVQRLEDRNQELQEELDNNDPEEIDGGDVSYWHNVYEETWDDLMSAQREASELEGERDQLQEEVVGLEHEVIDLENRISDLEDIETEFDALKEEVENREALQTELLALELQVRDLELRRNVLEVQVAELRATIREAA